MMEDQLGKIYAGEVHYSRIPVEYWEHRILMIKALGLNCLSVYIMWNYHEVQRGKFDFQNGNKNLPLFLQLAQKYEMMVLFRPGPYVCAEWDLGGLPPRLYTVKDLVIRSTNAAFLEQSKIYFEALVPIMRKHLRNKQNPKGCIVMLQIENQYGFYGTDKTYMQEIRKIWHNLGIHCHQYYVDWLENIEKCHWEGASIGINDFKDSKQQERVRQFQKKGKILGGQIYSGWMTHWAENKWGSKSIQRVLKEYEFLCGNGHSFAMYMVHGGTNFGLTAGANGLRDKPNDYWGAITSYDYDAPINEQGSATPKYKALRQLILKYVDWAVPQIPPSIPMINLPQIKPIGCGSLLNNLPEQSVCGNKPLVFETNELKMFNQGIVVYEGTVEKVRDYDFKAIVHDFALVYLGKKLIKVLDRTSKTEEQLKVTANQLEEYGNKLIFLVEASGHINFDREMETDQKGLYKLEGYSEGEIIWKMKKVPLQFQNISAIKSKGEEDEAWGATYPRIYEATFQLEEVGDTYLNLGSYGKGYVWINGVNLGRYWQIGPQNRMFCPGVWMNKGVNKLTILNIWGEAGSIIQGAKDVYGSPLVYDQ